LFVEEPWVPPRTIKFEIEAYLCLPKKPDAAGRKEHIVFTAKFALFAMIFRVKPDVMTHIFLLITTLKAAGSRLLRH
jgi:Ni,Fe-hydrogenase I cytochrome b subunit